MARSCLVIIDMQYATGSEDHGLGAFLRSKGETVDSSYRFSRIRETVVPNIKLLISAFRAKRQDVVYVQYGARHSGAQDVASNIRGIVQITNNIVGNEENKFISELRPRSDEPVFFKTTQSAFVSTDIGRYLRRRGASDVYFVGVSTNNCVDTSARDAVEEGFDAVLVDDACGTCSQELHVNATKTFEAWWGRLTDTRSLLRKVGQLGDGTGESLRKVEGFQAEAQVPRSENTSAVIAEASAVHVEKLALPAALIIVKQSSQMADYFKGKTGESPPADNHGLQDGLGDFDELVEQVARAGVEIVNLSCAESCEYGLSESGEKVPAAIGSHVIASGALSGFHNPELDSVLRNYGVKTLIFAGGYADAALDHTMRGAADRSYSTIVLIDCLEWSGVGQPNALLNTWRRGWCSLWTSDNLISKV